MAANNVEFFARMQRLQKQQNDSEQQRMELEHKFNTYLSSDKRLSRLKAAKLQRMWEKVCDDEKRSKARNEQLLKDYHRVEAHVAALSTRTERLRLLKDQYERQVELMYPRWKEQLQARIVQQQMTLQRKQQQENAMQGYPVYNSAHQPMHTYPSQLNSTPSIGQSQQMQYGTQLGQRYLSPLNGTPSIGQSPQMQYGTSHHGHGYPSSINGTLPHSTLNGTRPQSTLNSTLPQDTNVYGTQPHGTHPQTVIPQSTGPYGAQPQNGHLLHGQSLPFQQTNGQVPAGHTSADQRNIGSYNEQAGAYRGQRLHSEGLEYTEPDDMSRKTPSPYDTLTRPNSKVQAPVFDDSRGNYTQLMQDPDKSRLVPGSMKPPVTEEEDYSNLRRGSEDQMAAQSQKRPQQQLPQQENQEMPQQNVRPNQYRPKSDSVGESSSTISVSSDSHYSGSDIRPQITVTSSQQAANAMNKPKDDRQRTDAPSNENLHHVDDANKQRHVNGNDDYLIPTLELGGKDSKLDFVTPGRTARCEGLGNGKVPASSRTELFSSESEEDEDEEEEDEEEEEEDEDSTALRGAMQDQLAIQDTINPVVRVEVTKHESPKEQDIPKQSQENTNQNEEKKDATEDEDEMEESESEIGSDMSLPLSDTEGQPKPSGTTTVDTTSSKPSDAINSPILTVKAFWTLVHTVEIEIDQSDNIGGIYNSPPCTEAIKNEIIKSANQNSGLSRLDPNAVSMVVIQSLPSIVATLPGGCLMSDKMLSSTRPINEISVRSFIYSAALGFWDQFLRHMSHLIKKGVLEPDEVAEKLAPQLISPESKMADKAVQVLYQILEDVQGDDSYLDESSMSMTQPTPRRQPEPTEEGNQEHLKVPRLNLGDTDRSDRTEEDSEEETDGDDSFFDSKPLTETDAYQRLLGNTYDKPKADTTEASKDGMDDESSSEDEIEKAARITPETPTSANRKKRNVLSSLGGALSPRSDDDDNDDIENQLKVTGGGESTQRSDAVSSRRSDAVSSPSQSDRLSSASPPGTGYIPSAMEHSIKSTARSEKDPLQRSAAFWGEESDMDESEMSVPMGTGTMTGTMKSEEKDEFDFYD